MIPDTFGADPTALPNPLEKSMDCTKETPHSLNPEPPTLNPGRGRPPIFDAVKQHTFLRLVSVGFSTRRAARLVGVSPSTVREKARTSPPFACGYEDAKAQAIPSLAENVYHAGKRSWRASAWLLERLRPSQFGHRVALGPDPAKRRETERLRQEKKKERLDLQKPEWNDQILIRCIHRLLTDPQAQEIFDTICDDFDRKAAEQAKAPEQAEAAGAQYQSPTDSIEDSDITLVHESTDYITSSDQRAANDLAPQSDLASPDPAQTTFTAPPPSANKSPLSTTSPTAETQAAQPELDLTAAATLQNSCAFTPRANCAEIPQAICTAQPPIAPRRPPLPSDSPPRPFAMSTFR